MKIARIIKINTWSDTSRLVTTNNGKPTTKRNISKIFDIFLMRKFSSSFCNFLLNFLTRSMMPITRRNIPKKENTPPARVKKAPTGNKNFQDFSFASFTIKSSLMIISYP